MPKNDSRERWGRLESVEWGGDRRWRYFYEGGFCEVEAVEEDLRTLVDCVHESDRLITILSRSSQHSRLTVHNCANAMLMTISAIHLQPSLFLPQFFRSAPR